MRTYAFVFMLVVLCSYVQVQNPSLIVQEKRMCSLKSDEPKGLIDVREMLLSIKGLSLLDTEELP